MKTYRKNKIIFITLAIILAILICTLNGCASINSWVQTLKGELIGNSYTIWEYDNFGNQILTVHGNKVALEGGTDSDGMTSSYVDITIDGKRWEHVGNTLVFAQNDADMVTDFQLPGDIESSDGSTGLIAVDRVINNYKNAIGKKLVVVVFSQTGAPICMFQGDECYTEVPADLPKTTKIYIDGNLVYVHRANVDIFPAELLK